VISITLKEWDVFFEYDLLTFMTEVVLEHLVL